jgi:hypothetical protein
LCQGSQCFFLEHAWMWRLNFGFLGNPACPWSNKVVSILLFRLIQCLIFSMWGEICFYKYANDE